MIRSADTRLISGRTAGLSRAIRLPFDGTVGDVSWLQICPIYTLLKRSIYYLSFTNQGRRSYSLPMKGGRRPSLVECSEVRRPRVIFRAARCGVGLAQIGESVADLRGTVTKLFQVPGPFCFWPPTQLLWVPELSVS